MTDLREEWAVRYEVNVGPTMDNPSGIRTQVHVVASAETARAAVTARIPSTYSSITNRRVSRRLVSDWEDVPD